ncbi:MAG TPA: mechanosensitive ion channel domain-containing protein [Methylomirabilota bacterium]
MRCAGALGLVLAVAGVGQAQTAPSAAPTESAGPIPLSEVAARAAELRGLLDTQEAAVTPPRDIQAILDALPGQAEQLRARLEQTRAQLEGSPPLAVVEQLSAGWEVTRSRLRGWNEVLTQWAGRVEQERTRLASLRESWLRTREGSSGAGAPKVVLDQIDAIVTAINTTRTRVESRLSTLLTAQYRLALLQRRTDEALGRTAQARADRLRRLGQRDGPPLWNRGLWAGAVAQTAAAGRDVLAAEQALVVEIGQQHASRVPLHALLFLILLAVLWRGRRAARRWNADDPTIGTVVEVFNRPISSALVVSCFATPWIYEEATPALVRLVALVAIVPVLRLIRPSLDRAVAPVLYLFGALFLIDALRSVIASAPLFEHLVFLGEMLAASAGMLWVLKPREQQVALIPAVDAMEAAALRLFGRLLLAAFATAFVVGSLGYVGLGRLIGAGALGSAYFGLAILAALQVAKGLIAVLLRSRPLGLLSSVQQARVALERRIVRVLRWIGVLAWIAATLASLTLLSGVSGAVRLALTAQWGWGAIRVSLGDLAVFALTIWLSFVVATAVRLLLSEDVFPRVRLARGLPLAMSLVIQYVLVLSGLTLALAALGVDLTKLTILAGAFGVGAGLGLQNLVNNFASGLILLFERPLHLGDVVQIPGVAGEVRHIGARATLVRTADGAEVFIPNSQLVAQNVTNWTYSDLRRRIVLPVKVAYGAAPRQVSELLVAIAAKHPLVLDQPAPAVVLMGFGEYSLDFELRAWTDRFGDAETIQSELADAVYAGLIEARIELPVPRRDVRLWRAEPPPQPG